MSRRHAVVLLVALASATPACSGTTDRPSSAAECAPAEVVVGHTDEEVDAAVGTPVDQPPTAKVGDLLVARGAQLFERCSDDGRPSQPFQRLRLYVVQGSARVSVAQVVAADDGTFRVRFGVPPGLTAGAAALVLEDMESQPVTGTAFEVVA